MNKNEFINEIYEFEKELARNYDRSLLPRNKFSPYYINKGVLVRQVYDEEISASDLKTTEELITFYENFFRLVDEQSGSSSKLSNKNDSQKSKSKYFNKLESFLTTGYDAFERIYNNPSTRTDSLSIILKKKFQKDFIYEVAIKGKTLSKWYKFEYNKYAVAFVSAIIGVVAVIFALVASDNLIFPIIWGSLFSIPIVYDVIKTQYTLRKNRITKIEEEFFSNIFEIKSAKEFFKYIKLCKYENYLNDYFKDDVLYEELKRRNNFNTTNSENEIVGN